MACRRISDHAGILAAGLLLILVAAASAEEPKPMLPTSGEPVPRFEQADSWMREFLEKKGIPGASLAIAIDGEVKLARGYGYADRDEQTPVIPESLFRIASISKPITAVAVMKLVEEGKLRLDDKVIDLLELRSHEAHDYDPWWNEITLAHLLTHTAGWDRARSGDPMFLDQHIATWLGGSLPQQHGQLIRYQFLRPVDFAPGERYIYSNFGYCLLGRVIEQASGQSYEEYVRQRVFAPLGIESPRVGRSFKKERCEGEVCYYTVDRVMEAAVTGPEPGKYVPVQYGGWQQELLDSHGGWIASSVDLVKFGAALDIVDEGKSTRGKLLSPETVNEMFTAKVGFNHASGETFPGYGYGWVVTRLDDTPFVLHNGALPCTAAVLCRLDDNVWFAALCNMGRTRDGQWLANGLDRELGVRIREALQEGK